MSNEKTASHSQMLFDFFLEETDSPQLADEQSLNVVQFLEELRRVQVQQEIDRLNNLARQYEELEEM